MSFWDTTKASPGNLRLNPEIIIQVYEVRLVNDGSSSLQAIALTLSDLSSSTGITASAITQLSVYKSTDAVFDAPSDSLLGTQTIVNIGAPTTVSLTAPLTWSSDFPYFLGVATFNSTHTDELSGFKDAFCVGSNAGAIQTSSGNVGSVITADDAVRHTIDIIATIITFATLPSDPAAANGVIVSGQVFTTQPVVEAQNAAGQRDLNFTGTANLELAAGSISLSVTTGTAFNTGRADFGQSGFKAQATGLPDRDSATLTADIVATRIAFSTAMSADGGGIVNDQIFTTQPVVEARDGDGQRDIHSNDIQVILGITSGNAVLSGATGQALQNGLASFSGRSATGTSELFQISASALGLFADTLSVTLHAGPVTAIELSAPAPSIQLGETDNVELSALLSAANGNLAERGDNQVLFTLVGPGSFASCLSAVDADSGIARTLVTAAEAGTLVCQSQRRRRRRHTEHSGSQRPAPLLGPEHLAPKHTRRRFDRHTANGLVARLPRPTSQRG